MRIKSKKKLALLVGMALTVGTSMAVSPMEAYAFTSVGYSEFKNGADEHVQGMYTVTKYDGTKEIYGTDKVDEAVKAALESLAKDTEDSAINFGLWKDMNGSVATEKITNFKKALAKEDMTINAGKKIGFTQSGGAQVVLSAGEAESGRVNIGADGAVTVKSNMDSVGVVGTSANIEVADGATLGTVALLNENVTLTVSGDGNITAVGATKDCKISGETKINNLGVNGDLTSDTTLNADNVNAGGNVDVTGDINGVNVVATGKIKAKSLTVAGDVKAGGALEAENITAQGNLAVGGDLTAKEVTANSVTLNGTVTNSDGSGKITIKADSVTLGTATATEENINKLSITPNTKGGTVNVKVVTSNGALPDETITKAIKAAAGAEVKISATSEAAETAKADAEKAVAAADKALEQVNEFAAKDVAEIAQANPFTTKLPSASDIAAIANPSSAKMTAVEGATTDLKTAIGKLEKEIANANGNTDLQAELEAKKAELQNKMAGLSNESLQAKAAELTAAVQQAGKTAAAPGVASARTATVVTNVMTANVTGRTSELRGFASAVDEGRPAPDNVWFQYKHTDMDVDNGDVYGKSTVKTNNYQLGYDAKVGPNDYLGAYIGTTTGNVEFNAPAVTDRTDIDNAYDFGIYGTHMLPSDQYIDYMIHTGKFDSKYNGVTWGTKDTGAMVGYGAKIAQNDRLTWNPYIQLAYDKVSVDSYMAGANYIASDDSNNWTAKLGINLLDVSGFYGGLAYSRGLSGSYNAYINGVPMPSQDNNANVLYMSLGYRANMSRNVFLDLSMEKTFADYNGWTAAGKVNFYF